MGFEGANESYDLADFLLQATDQSSDLCAHHPDSFNALNSVNTLSDISSFIAHDNALPLTDKWELLIQTTKLPSSWPARNECIAGLNKAVHLEQTSPSDALAEVVRMDEEAAILNRSCAFMTCLGGTIEDQTLPLTTVATSEEHVFFAA